MPPDNIEPDPLTFFGLKDREVLSRLAEIDGRTEIEELRWLIRARAFGRLKDLGDDRVSPQVYEADLSEYLRVKSLRLEKAERPPDDTNSTVRTGPKLK